MMDCNKMINELEKLVLKICKEDTEKNLDNLITKEDIDEFKNYPHIFVLGAIMDRQNSF
jgi:hypothetical protein